MIYNANLDGGLKLSRDALVGIFNGTIRFWSDPLIQMTNPDTFLPTLPIVAVHRTDSCTATLLFSQALSSFSPDWKKTYGSGYTINWYQTIFFFVFAFIYDS